MTKLALVFETSENEYETPLKTYFCCTGIQFFNFNTFLTFHRKCEKKNVKKGNQKLELNKITCVQNVVIEVYMFTGCFFLVLAYNYLKKKKIIETFLLLTMGGVHVEYKENVQNNPFSLNYIQLKV